jgi:hypothetical protein
MQPFPAAISDLKIDIQLLDIFDHRPVQIRNTDLQTVSHRQFVRVHQEFIRQRRPDLKQLKSDKLVVMRNLQHKPLSNRPFDGFAR